jgi:1-aminocyclopropane-1-carboxylate deaminase/D-cysteine desulfhydrase-like pyridoxal-dependent ACC family enzyme
LQFLPHLSKRLAVQVYIKRDDLTDLALGGDKARKLEYEIAQARAGGADVLVTCGSSQSNHARLTTAAARKVGMECAVILSHDMWHTMNGNLLAVHLMGAQIHVVEAKDHWDLEQQAAAWKSCASWMATISTWTRYMPLLGRVESSLHCCLP